MGSSLRSLVKSADRSWRLLATGLSFLLFGLGSLLGGLVIVPLIWLFIRKPQQQRRVARSFIGTLMRGFVAMVSMLGLVRWRVCGTDQVDPASGYLIVANHPSLIDVVFLLALFPQADCVVKSALWRNPFTALTVRALGYVSNLTPIATLQECIDRLRDGASLILFPEGTRTVPGRPLAFQVGAAAIAVRADCTLLPVVITCRPTTLIKGEPWYRIPERRIQFELAIQPPVRARRIVEGEVSRRAATTRLNEYMVDFFEERLRVAQSESNPLGV